MASKLVSTFIKQCTDIDFVNIGWLDKHFKIDTNTVQGNSLLVGVTAQNTLILKPYIYISSLLYI